MNLSLNKKIIRYTSLFVVKGGLFFSSIFLFFSVALLAAASKATEKERKIDEWMLFYFTISHELQFNYIFNLTQAIPYKLNSSIIRFIKFSSTKLQMADVQNKRKVSRKNETNIIITFST